jgi:hypothetical protein
MMFFLVNASTEKLPYLWRPIWFSKVKSIPFAVNGVDLVEWLIKVKG